MRFVRASSIVIGVLMIGQWLFFLLTGNVPELQTAPVSITFHIAIELAAAVVLIGSGVSLRKEKTVTVVISSFAQGMLAYTVVNSPGYFAQRGEYVLVAMFFLLLIVAVFNLYSLSAAVRGSRGITRSKRS